MPKCEYPTVEDMRCWGPLRFFEIHSILIRSYQYCHTWNEVIECTEALQFVVRQAKDMALESEHLNRRDPVESMAGSVDTES